jgi:outer membrane protein
MTKFVRILAATVFGLSLSALAQTAPATTTPPATDPATATPNAPSAATAAPIPTGTKVGTINIEGAVFASNEGRRDFDALSKKLEPKQNELKGLSDELDALKKQLSTQGDKMNEDAAATLRKQIEAKQKVFDRSLQDAREEAQSQQGEIMQRIVGKMGSVIMKYAADNGYGVLLDTSQQWPQGSVIPIAPAMDITQAVVAAYNVKSGVPAPPPTAAGASKPAAPAAKPATKPATPPATKPATTTPPKQ